MSSHQMPSSTILPSNVDEPRFTARHGTERPGRLDNAQTDLSDQFAEWYARTQDDEASLGPLGWVLDALLEALKQLPFELHH